MRLLGGVPHLLLWIPAVLHRQGELRVHLLLQHPPLQRAPEEAPHPLSGDVQSAFSLPLPHLPPAAAPPCDVG